MRLLHWGLPEPLSALERSPRSGFETRGGLGPVDILWSVTGGVNNCQHIRSHGTHQTCKLPSAMRIYGFIDQHGPSSSACDQEAAVQQTFHLEKR